MSSQIKVEGKEVEIEGTAVQEPRVAQEPVQQAPQPKRFRCPECQAQHTVPEVADERAIEDEGVTEKGLVEHGLKCPNCDYWLHAYFSTPKQRKAQRMVQQRKLEMQRKRNNHTVKVYNGAVKRHRKLFDATQKRIRKLVGVKAGPAEILKKIKDFKKAKAKERAAAEAEAAVSFTAEDGAAVQWAEVEPHEGPVAVYSPGVSFDGVVDEEGHVPQEE